METTKFDFSTALIYLKAGRKIENPRGDIIYLENGQVICIPKFQYPKGKRIEFKVYWDSILSDNWCLFDDSELK